MLTANFQEFYLIWAIPETVPSRVGLLCAKHGLNDEMVQSRDQLPHQ